MGTSHLMASETDQSKILPKPFIWYKLGAVVGTVGQW